MTSSAFSFIKLVVADLEAAEHFYCGVFGLEVRHRHASDEHAYAQRESMLFLPGQSIPFILTHYERLATPPAGAAWVGFTVADIEATLAALEQAGGTIRVPVHVSASHPVKAAIAADPDGHLIEVIQMLDDGTQ